MGPDSLSLQDALRVMSELNDLEALERRLRYAQRTNDVTSLDLAEIERLLGEEARWMAERMQEVARVLEDAGLIRRKGNELLLTPRAMRRVGEHALKDIFGNVDAAPAGDHTLTRRGAGLEPGDETKRFAWGDAFGLVDTSRTVMNAVLRDGATTPVRVTADDFEVRPTLALTQCSTVIMLDMSYSMMQGGRFQAGRRIAIALDSLIRSKYPKDNLYIIAFSYVVLSLKPEQLLDSYWVQYGGGTNFQQALRQARQTLARHHIGTKQIVFITDGEPTTAYSSWDDDDEAVIDPVTGLKRIPDVTEETLREVMRCTQDRITLNTFILDSHPATGDLMRNMARINRGRAFFGSAQDIGKYVLLDYVHNKKHTVG
ncbi:MAG: VWA domain-containing protein [Chloroflexi bacterium]|nr:MAG: VWA domain-containing protein [Chloroflexota bacterium]